MVRTRTVSDGLPAGIESKLFKRKAETSPCFLDMDARPSSLELKTANAETLRLRRLEILLRSLLEWLPALTLRGCGGDSGRPVSEARRR